MATTAMGPARTRPNDRFFLISAIVMTVVIVGGFLMQLAMGRSSFRVPLYVHLHAAIFFGWTALYLLQAVLATTGSIALHRRLGWLALGWIPALVAMGIYMTVMSERTGRTPFFFTPAYFLIMNPASVLGFAGLAGWAIAVRRRTAWHRRLMVCAMAMLTGPGFGRLLPLPFVIPWAGWMVFAAVILFPIAGMIADRRRLGRVHPAWWWGAGVMLAVQIGMDVVSASPVTPALYRVVMAGSPGAGLDPYAYPPPPWAAPHR